jgi:hypothetical protein
MGIGQLPRSRRRGQCGSRDSRDGRRLLLSLPPACTAGCTATGTVTWLASQRLPPGRSVMYYGS